ncbi:MAG: GNAT family N-acetyltransferase [Hyphomicrobiaceae bacterium]
MAKALSETPQIRLRPATLGDWDLIRSWLNLQEIQDWWGPATRTEGGVLAALKSEHALARIIEVDGCDVGYIQAVDATLWGEQLPSELPPGTWDIDLFVADQGIRGRGVGSQALRMIRDEVFATTLAPAVCIFASVENERAIRAYERAGFAWQSVWHDPVQGPSWFMICGRP